MEAGPIPRMDGPKAMPGVYTWAALQDEPGLVDLMGGRDKYNAKLDEHFAGHHNVHSNEPSHHYGYLLRLQRRAVEDAGQGA